MNNVVYHIRHKGDESLARGYIGITNRTLKRRFSIHKNEKRIKSLVTDAIHKYGDGLEMIALYKNLDRETALIVEKLLRPLPAMGWNIREGGGDPPGFGGRKHSEATKKKMSEWQKGKPKLSPSVLTRAKISQATSGENNPFFGKKHTAESIAKISASQKERFARKKLEGGNA